jgi:SCY1-like protein 2
MEALYFMHSQVNLIHGNINLGSVLISRHGDWKLFGFNFSTFTQYQTNRQNNYNFKEWNNKQLPLSPLLEFLAPEHIMSDSVDVQCDMYSFGMLIFAIFNGGKPLFACHNNTLTYKHNIEQISRISETSFGDTPPQLCSLVKSLLATEPSVRPDALEVTKHAYFEDVLVNGLQYIDKLVEKTDMERSQWFKNSLGRLLTKYPKRVLHQRILPGLATEFRNHKMIPFVLPLVLLIAEDCSVQEYNDLILPILIPAFTIYDPIQIPLIFLQKMDLLLKLTGPDLKKKHILPMILGSMEADSHQVQELCVSILPTFADMIDYTSMKHSIVPRITQLCLETGQNSVCCDV